MNILFEILAVVAFGLSVFNFIKVRSCKESGETAPTVVPQPTEQSGGFRRIVCRPYLRFHNRK